MLKNVVDEVGQEVGTRSRAIASRLLFSVVSRVMPSGAWFRSALALVPSLTVYSRLSSGRAGQLMPTLICSLSQGCTLRRTRMQRMICFFRSMHPAQRKKNTKYNWYECCATRLFEHPM